VKQNRLLLSASNDDQHNTDSSDQRKSGSGYCQSVFLLPCA